MACQLGYHVLKFETKSTHKANDLFYLYDALGRFQAKQLEEKVKKTQDYITYKALGLAILLANEPEVVQAFLPSNFASHIKHILGADFEFNQPQRSIVLVDEIDKAPRDFPNNILNEVEKSYFYVPELGELGNKAIEAPANKQPILVLTSNGEKILPDAFLRRCIYYNIPFPDEERLQKIIAIRLAAQIEDINYFLTDALQLFWQLREAGLRKKPSTAELLNWLLVLREVFKEAEKNPFKGLEKIHLTLNTLVKTAEDQELAKRVLERFLKK